MQLKIVYKNKLTGKEAYTIYQQLTEEEDISGITSALNSFSNTERNNSFSYIVLVERKFNVNCDNTEPLTTFLVKTINPLS